MTAPQRKVAEPRSPSPIGTFGRRGSAFPTDDGSDNAAQSPPLATPTSALSSRPSQEIERIADSPRARGKRRMLQDVEPDVPRTPSRFREEFAGAHPALSPSSGRRPSRSDDGAGGSEDGRRQGTQQSSRDSSYDIVAETPGTGYGRGEQGGFQSPVPVKRTLSPDLQDSREQWMAQRDRSRQEQDNERNQPSSSRATLDRGRLDSPSRSLGLAPAVEISGASAQYAESGAARPLSPIQSSIYGPGDRERLVRSPRLIPQERDSRALSLPERPEAIPVRASAHRTSLTFLNPQQSPALHGDDGELTEMPRPSKSRRRDRVQSAPHGRLMAPAEPHGLPLRSSRHQRHVSSSGHLNAIPQRRSGSLYTTARLSQVGDQEALDIVARQRRLSTAYSMAIAALEPRLPPSEASLSRSHSPLSFHKGARLPQDGGGSIHTPTKRDSLRLAAHRTLLPYRIAAPLLLTIFLDFNSLFVLGQLGAFPGSDAEARQQAAWWIAFGIYAAATCLHLALVGWNFYRSHVIQKDERGALAVQEYLSYYGRLVMMLRSPRLHAFVRHADAMASRKQRLIESSARWGQSELSRRLFPFCQYQC